MSGDGEFLERRSTKGLKLNKYSVFNCEKINSVKNQLNFGEDPVKNSENSTKLVKNCETLVTKQ